MPYKDIEKKRACGRAWTQRNRDQKREYLKQWRKDNPEKANAARMREYWRNPEKFRALVTSRKWAVRPEDRPAIAAMRLEECFYCGDPGGQIDHLVPRSLGGSNELWNLVPACKYCNGRKQANSLEQFYKENPPIFE